MNLSNPDVLFYLLIAFFSGYIVLQIYIVFKLKTIIHKLFEILLHFDVIMIRFKGSRKKAAKKVNRSCQNCKYRLPFYSNTSKIENSLYYRCQITGQKVSPNNICNNFIFDPQTLDV